MQACTGADGERYLDLLLVQGVFDQRESVFFTAFAAIMILLAMYLSFRWPPLG